MRWVKDKNGNYSKPSARISQTNADKTEPLQDKLNRIKTFVIECDADNRAPQPYEILDIIND
jgi:hypothetical protein